MRRVLSLLAALLFCTAPLAVADDAPPVGQPSKQGSNAVGACLDAGQVWLYVADVDGTVVANQCVGTPDTGEAALRAANVTIEHDKSGLICSLGGRPDPCPKKFDGSFWNYWHASVDEMWVFSSKGAKEWKPKPGTIEGWCRNHKDTKGCTPSPLRVEIDGELRLPSGVSEADLTDPEVVTPEAVPEAGFPTGTVVAVGVIVVLGAAAVVIVRQRRGPSGA
ncbi:hypothetical protein [uncultured Tessaracoccus sp.]|uniref:hypothetical protein n=1 Tax=uncultured Tessaracoccus sp. TaxID=905023 RepID=UPI002603ED4A|nr:hypothetical protein [uncultured Tessaracoccus sp.]